MIVFSNVFRANILSTHHLLLSQVAPIAIIGGTASVYSIALDASPQFTPISLMYLLLLALNYAVMPRLSKRYIHPEMDKGSVALAEEVVKMGIGIGGWIMTNWATVCNLDSDQSCPAGDVGRSTATDIKLTYNILSSQLSQWSLSSTLIAAGLPSLLYAIQGTLTYHAYQHLDSLTFNGLMQFKVLTSALGCYIIMGKKLSGMQLGSLVLLMISTVVFQGSWKVKDSKDGRYSRDDQRCTFNQLWLGVLPCLGATLLSGLAGAFSQRSLQMDVGSVMHRDAYFYTIEVSFLSAVFLVISLCLRGRREILSSTEREDRTLFKHCHWTALLPIITKATAGVLTALVHRHLGSVIKGFALVLGLVFSALLQFVLDDKDLTMEQNVGTALVLLSSWLHFTNPAK